MIIKKNNLQDSKHNTFEFSVMLNSQWLPNSSVSVLNTVIPNSPADTNTRLIDSIATTLLDSPLRDLKS